jgi:hypothetical protein
MGGVERWAVRSDVADRREDQTSFGAGAEDMIPFLTISGPSCDLSRDRRGIRNGAFPF